MTEDQLPSPSFILPETSDRVLCFLLDGPIKVENYEIARALCKEMLEKRQDIRVLIQCRNNIVWSEATARQDLSFTMDYGARISRIALVNPPPTMISLFKIKDALHSKRQVRYFSDEEFAEALAWVEDDIA